MKNQDDSQSAFRPGLDLAERFFRHAVRPILESTLPDLEYSAALIGPGSEVLGFDSKMSTDHHWGPRAMLFLRPRDIERHRDGIHSLLAGSLPLRWEGYSTSWSEPDPDDGGVQHLCPVPAHPVNHRVELYTVKAFFQAYMDIDIDKPLSAADWLTLPHQKLRSVCGGRIFRDELGLGAVRERLSWYPHDVWLYLLASCWSRIGEEEHLTGRAGIAGDDIGSSIIAWRLVRDVMRLAFLMERVYPPYAKWFGTAFRHLRCAPALLPTLDAVMNASSWEERDPALALAFQHLAGMHNALKITPNLSCEPSRFWGRPFTVIQGERFADALRDAIQDKSVTSIATRPLIGNIDLVSDSTGLLEDAGRRRSLLTLYQ